MGVPVSPRNIFPSNIQGLPTWYEVRVCEAGWNARRGGADLMVAMNPQTWEKDVAEVTPGGPGTITYAPGTVGLHIKFQGSDGGTLATRTGNCAKPLNPPNVDVVTITAATVKAPSRIGTGVVYKPGTKKLTVAGKVFANPDQVVTGNMNFKLFKAGKVIRNVTSALSQSVAKRTFGGKIGKGTYYVKFTYYGSPKVKAATATRKVVIR